MKLCDRVVVGGDDNRFYLDFWPFIAYAYRTIFGVPTTLALVTDRRKSDPLVMELQRHGDVELIPTVTGYPIGSQAKMARFLVAATRGKEVCYIDDLDLIPIDREWHLAKTAQRAPGSMLLIGREVYGNAYPNQVPASMMTAEGHVFTQMLGFDPEYALTKEVVERQLQYYWTLRARDDDHSNIKNPHFSDEALIVHLRAANKIAETHVERGYVTGRNTIDRGYWPFSQARLEEGGYIHAHTARPYRDYKAGNDAIMSYIKQRYGGAELPQPLSE